MTLLHRARKGALVMVAAFATAITTTITGLQVAAAPPALADPDATVAVERGRPPRVGHPLVIAHRGASGYRPEHTLAAYELAIRLGADFIEPDLVATSDGVLVARHENEISGTTDVASHPEFANRRTTKVVDGDRVTGWFTEDFTLDELKTLRAIERLPTVRPANTRYNGRFEVPTFDEVLELAKRESRGRRDIGVYPETKHPTYFDSIGLSLEEQLAADLKRYRLNRRSAPVFVQSFETGNLRELSRKVKVPLVQLVTTRAQVTPAALREIATYADGLGPTKGLVIPRDSAGFLREPTSLVDDAHAAGLAVHIWTMRDENQFLPADFRVGSDPNAKGDAFGEYEAFFATGVDGVFADHPDTAVAVREAVGGRHKDPTSA